MLWNGANGNTQLEQPASVEATIGPMHDLPCIDSTALHRFHRKYEAFCFVTYIFRPTCTASYLLIVYIGQAGMADTP